MKLVAEEGVDDAKRLLTRDSSLCRLPSAPLHTRRKKVPCRNRAVRGLTELKFGRSAVSCDYRTLRQALHVLSDKATRTLRQGLLVLRDKVARTLRQDWTYSGTSEMVFFAVVSGHSASENF